MNIKGAEHVQTSFGDKPMKAGVHSEIDMEYAMENRDLELNLPDEKDVDLTPKGDDSEFISGEDIRKFAIGLGLAACVSTAQAQHVPEVNIYLPSGRHEVPEEMLNLAMTENKFSWFSSDGEEHSVHVFRHRSKRATAEQCGFYESKVRFSYHSIYIERKEPILGCYRSVGHTHIIHAWVNKGEYTPIMVHELGHFIGQMEDQDSHFHRESDRDRVYH